MTDPMANKEQYTIVCCKVQCQFVYQNVYMSVAVMACMSVHA